jgi:hypothetical protein
VPGVAPSPPAGSRRRVASPCDLLAAIAEPEAVVAEEEAAMVDSEAAIGGSEAPSARRLPLCGRTYQRCSTKNAISSRMKMPRVDMPLW